MELPSLKTKVKSYLSSLILAVVLFISLFLGIRQGQKIAQAESVLSTVSNLDQGLKFFYQDQDRYPTIDEFNNKSLMLDYFNVFPPTQFNQFNCSQSWVYKRSDSQNYELDFCLPVQVNNWAAGWNTYH